jgi:hypothetical protein
MLIHHGPLFDLVQGSKAAETGQIIVEATIPDARGLCGAVDNAHSASSQVSMTAMG